MPKQTVSLWLDSEIVHRLDSVRGVSSRSATMNGLLKERLLQAETVPEKREGQ